MSRPFLLPLVLVSLAEIACSSASLADGRAASPSDFRWRKALDGPTRVEIKDVDGGIRAEGTSEDFVEIVAVKSGRREDFERVQVVVREEAGAIVACALYPGMTSCSSGHERSKARGDVKVRVDFVVRLPSKVTSIVARTMNGNVVASRVVGEARLATMNGRIEVDAAGAIDAETMNGNIVARAAKGSPVRLETKNGRIDLTLPPDAAASVEASTVRGTLASDFGGASSPRFPGMPSSSRFAIGGGGVPVKLATLNGDIALRHAL